MKIIDVVQMRRAARFAIGMVVLIAAFAIAKAEAAYSCSVTVTALTITYDPTVATENITAGSYTVSCTRSLADSATLNYTLAANNGLQPTGSINRVQLGASANRYQYELYRLSPYTNANRWQAAASERFSGTISFGAGLTGNDSKSFDLRLAGSQPVVPAGTYTDTVTVTLRNGTTVLNTSTFNVRVITSNNCQIVTSPGNINLTYTSFQAAVATASTAFRVRCTTALPYSLSLDAPGGTLLGLNYTIVLPVASGTGTGATQTYIINGSISAGQAGTCAIAACSGNQTRMLTVTY